MNDTVSLTTGGVIAGAGVESSFDADLRNTVTIGGTGKLSTFGLVGIGTTTTAIATTDAAVSTYGLAGIGVATAETSVTSNQSVDVGADTRITGFDNVYVTPGRDVFSNVNTSIVATSNANALVRGLIAVPDATATTNIVSNASLNLAAGTNTESAQNVIVGSYQGFLTAQADGTGRGYQLGFIPVTQHDSNKNVSSSAPVKIAGNITAGIYHELVLVIDCGTGVTCGATTAVVAELKSGAPTIAAISSNFEPDDYINSLGIEDVETRDALLAGTSSTAVQAVLLGQLFAAGGTVTINAGQIDGAGQVTSYGGPTISVTNSSAAYLILGDGAYIPDTPGGQIIFTGAAGQSQAGSLALNEVIGTGPSITIENTYTGPAPGDKPGYGPALFLHGDVTNLGGGVALTNATGSFGQFGNVSSRQLNITVPLGVTTISANGPGGLWSAGGSPIAEWKDYMYFPGGNPSAVASNVNQTVQFLANILYPASNSDDLNYNQLYQRSYDWIRPGTTHESQVFFGNCGIAGNWNENCYYGTQVQFTGQAYSFVDEEDDNEFQPWIGYYNTATRTAALSAANISGSQASAQVLGNQVVIKASVININGRIEAGWQTNWSLHLDDTLTLPGDAIDYFENLYANTGQVLHDLSLYSGNIAAGDKQIGAKYDAAANQIVLDDVHASSGGTSVILEGKIISSNLLGHIHINGGLGHVTVENETGIALVVNKVNTGSEDGASSTSSKIKIYDKLVTSGPNTTTYVFNPGAGINVYATNNGVNPVLDGATPDAPSFHIDGTETAYSPKDDIRFEWNRRATFNRYWSDINNIPGWTYSSGSTNDPGWYVSQNGVYNGPSSPQGYTVQGDATQADFIQQFSGSGNYSTAPFEYHNCITFAGINSCNWGFPLTGFDGDRYYGGWDYNFYYSGIVTLKQSVRADNPFKIDFSGNASGLVDITSNSNVTFAGNIINPTGDLNVVATAGAGKTAAVAMTSEGSILTKNMSLEGTSIGASTAAIRATLADDGILHANASQGAINIDLNSGATLSSISAGTAQARSDVTITATGDLVHGSGAGTDVTGNNITLSSGNGSVGTSATAVTMEARGTTLSGGDVVGGVINISAQDDINISHTGTVRAGQITSTGGDVTIRAIGGGIVDALGQTQSTNVSQESIDALSERLHLTSNDGAEQHAIDVSVKPFETLVDTSYDRYQQMLGQGSVSASAYTLDQAGFDRYRLLAKLALGLDTAPTDAQVQAFVDNSGVYSLNAGSIALYKPLAQAALGLAGPPTDTQVQDFVNSKYLETAAAFTRAFGNGWKTQADFVSPNPAFTFQADPALVASLTQNSVWRMGQLVSAIDAAALQPSSGVVGNATPNVVGRDVTLIIDQGIGSLAAPVSLTAADLTAGTLNASQQSALAVATTPGSVKGVGTDALGNAVTGIDLSNIPAGVTLTGFDVAQTAPVNVNSFGKFNASSGASVYLQATSTPQVQGGTLTIGNVTAAGDITLAAPSAIQVATDAQGVSLNAVQINTQGNLTMTAGAGSIGSSANPLTFDIAGDLIAAQAGDDAFLRAVNCNMRIGRVFAEGVASLIATNGSINGTLSGVSIAAHDIELSATGDIGSAGAALQLQIAPTGALTGASDGSIYIYSPTLGGQASVALHVADLSGRNGVSITVDGDLDADSLTSALGSITAASGSNATIDAATAAMDIAVTSVGDLAAMDLTAGGNIDLIADGSLSILAGGLLSASSAAIDISAASLDMAALSAINGATIGISVTGDAVLGQLSSAFNPGGAVTSVISVGANNIFGNGDGQTNLITANANAAVTLNAVTSIGTALEPLSIDSRHLIASPLAGDMNLETLGLLQSASLSSTGGNIAITGAGSVDIASLTTTAGAASIDVTGSVLLGAATTGTTLDMTSGSGMALGSLTSAGNMTVNAAGNIGFTQLTSTGASVSATSTAGTITGGDIDAQVNAGLTAFLATTGASISTTTGAITLSAASIDWNTLGSGSSTSATSTSGGITLANVNTRTTLALTSAAGLALGTMTSGTDQTITSVSDLAFTQLTAGRDVSATVSAGNLAGGSVLADRNAVLAASGDNTGNILETTTGAATLSAGGLVDWTSLRTGTSLTATSTEGSVDLVTVIAGTTVDLSSAGLLTLGTSTSVGTQTLTAAADIGFSALTSTGGSVGATSTGGDIAGTTITADDNVALTSNTGTVTNANTTATNGGVTVTANGTVGLQTTTAGGAVDLTSVTAGLTLDTVTSGGTQTLDAQTAITFTQLTSTGASGDPGNINVTSDVGAITGGSFDAAGGIRLNGNGVTFDQLFAGVDVGIASQAGITGNLLDAATIVQLEAGVPPGTTGDITIDVMRSAIFDLSSPGTLSFSHIDVADQITLAAKNVIAGISHVPNGSAPAGSPLHLTVTGYQGALGNQVRLNVNSAVGIFVDELSFRLAFINATSPRVTLADAYIPGTMTLNTPGQTILANNTSPMPVSGPNVQLYQPGGHFNLSVAGRNIVTSSYVVDFQPGSNVSVNTYNSSHTPFALFGGASLTGDSLRDMRNGQIPDLFFAGPDNGVPFYFRHLLPEFGFTGTDDGEIETEEPGVPAVNTSGEFDSAGLSVN